MKYLLLISFMSLQPSYLNVLWFGVDRSKANTVSTRMDLPFNNSCVISTQIKYQSQDSEAQAPMQ